jgi:hypothetical protein
LRAFTEKGPTVSKRRHLTIGLSIVALWGTLPAASLAQESGGEWKVGLAKVKITPAQPVFMAGYRSRNHPSETVASDLYAKALALEDRNGQVGVVVTADLIWLRGELCDAVAAAVADKGGLKREQLLFNASHIHTGPAPTRLSGQSEFGGSKNAPRDTQRNAAFTRTLQKQLADIILAALATRAPARLSWGQGVVNFPMNRREWTPKGVILGMNPRGPADRTAPVLRIDTPEGKLRAVLFGAATHNTTLGPDCYAICGDYAGFAQQYLETDHPGVQAMFMLGCAGDSDPYPNFHQVKSVARQLEHARAHGRELSSEVDRVLAAGKLRPVRGPLRLAYGTTNLPLEAPEQQKPPAATAGTPPNPVKARVGLWQFGKDLTLVALSGEVVVDYVGFVEKTLGPNQLWIAAYSNDVFGYLPSARLLREGGYKAPGVRGGRFAAKAQDVLMAKVRALAAQVGRPLPQK